MSMRVTMERNANMFSIDKKSQDPKYWRLSFYELWEVKAQHPLQISHSSEPRPSTDKTLPYLSSA